MFGKDFCLTVCALYHHRPLHSGLLETESSQADIEVDALNGTDLQGNDVFWSTFDNCD